MRQDPERIATQRWIKDRDYRFLQVNSALASVLERSPGTLIGGRDADFFPPGIVRCFRQDDALVGESGRSVLFFEPSVHLSVPGWITTKIPCRHLGVAAVAGVARPWSTGSLHEALAIPRPTGTRPTEATPWLLEADRRVRDRFRERLVIRDLADEAGVHPDYFGHRFRKVVGVRFHTLVRKLRVAWSLERLAEGNSELGRLAHRAGFADQSHFTRAFKREVGIPPGAFRDTLERAAL